MPFNSNIVYYLEKPKREIYYELKAQHLELRLSLSRFYKLCPKNFKKAKKMTDMCDVCEKGKSVEKKSQQILNSNNDISDDIIKQLQEEISYYHQHLYFKEQQQQCYKKSIEKITSLSCIIIMDFKVNFKIGGGPIETGNNFYEKSSISLLSFAIIYKENEQIHTKYFDYFSKILSHDSVFVTNCVSKLFTHPFLSHFHEIYFWSDSGPHFRSAELMHFIFEYLPTIYNKKFL